MAWQLVGSSKLGSYHQLEVWLEQRSQNIEANTSVVAYEFGIRRTSTSSGKYWTTNTNNSAWLSVDGANIPVSNFSYDFRNSTYKVLASSTRTVTHGSDGTKSVSINGTIQVGSGLLPSGNTSGSLSLTKINRYVNITSQRLETVDQDMISYSVATDRPFSQINYRLNDGSWKVAISGVSGGYYGENIDGLSPNTSYRLDVNVKAADSGLWTFKSLGTVKTSPLATASIVATSDNASRIDIKLTKPVSGNSMNVRVVTGTGVAITDWYKTSGTSTYFSLSQDRLNTIYKEYPSTATAKYYVQVQTFSLRGINKGTTSTSQQNFTITKPLPSIGTINYYDLNSTVSNLVGTNKHLVLGVSNMGVDMLSAIGGAYSNGNKTLRVVAGGQVKTTVIGQASTGGTITINAIKAKPPYSVSITDARGLSRTYTLNIVGFSEYSVPTITTVYPYRLNNYETPSYLTTSGFISAIKVGNVSKNDIVLLRYRVRLLPSGSFGGYVTINPSKSTSGDRLNFSSNHYIADYPSANSYEVELSITDKLGSVSTKRATLNKGVGLMSFFENKIQTNVLLEAKAGIEATSLKQNGQLVEDFNSFVSRAMGSTSFNNMWKHGIYRYENTVNANNAVGSPKIGAGWLVVKTIHDYTNLTQLNVPWAYVVQEYTALNGDIAKRYYGADGNGVGSWSGWRTTLDTNNGVYGNTGNGSTDIPNQDWKYPTRSGFYRTNVQPMSTGVAIVHPTDSRYKFAIGKSYSVHSALFHQTTDNGTLGRAHMVLDDNQVKDWVVEEGSSGMWAYRKWNSGRCEMWGIRSHTGPIGTSWGNLYESGVISRNALPFTLNVTRQYISCTRGSYSAWVATVNAPTGSQTSEVKLVSAVQVPSLAWDISFHIQGNWK